MATVTAPIANARVMAPNGSDVTIKPTDNSATTVITKPGDQPLWDPPLFVAGSKDRALTFTLSGLPSGTTSVTIALQNYSISVPGPKVTQSTQNADGTWTVTFQEDPDPSLRKHGLYHLGTGPDNSPACFSATVTLSPTPTGAAPVAYAIWHYWTMSDMMAALIK